MTTPDPFDRIPDPDSRYAGTILETTAERGQRAACPEPDRDGEDVTFPADSSPSTPLDDWDW